MSRINFILQNAYVKILTAVLLLLTALSSCSKESIDTDPRAEIVSAVKVYAGSNPSIKITYRLSNTVSVASTIISAHNYGFSGGTHADIPTTDGEAIVYDHSNFNPSATYYFTFNMKDGTKVSTPLMTFYF